MRGVSPGRARSGLAGSPAGPAETTSGAIAIASSHPKMASRFHCFPGTANNPPPPFGDGLVPGLRGLPPSRPVPAPRLPYLGSELWVPVAVGRGAAAGSVPGPDGGRCRLRWRCCDPRASQRVSGSPARGAVARAGAAGVGLAGACVSLALCCSERPRLCWNRRRCVYKGRKP